MCEYCGCQQIAVIDELTREHDAVVAILGSVRGVLAAGRLDDAAACCRELLALLGPHTAVEEDGLFPELADEYPDHVVALRAEHREIEGVLAEAVDGPPTDPTWPGRLERIAFLLREHILKEQDGVFPAALSTLDGDQWERVEQVRARAGSPLTARQ
jgi:hemerythrin-like domain-containing protein